MGPVPADGHPDAEVMFIGEAPGENEDRSGFPFQGRAGQFLDHLLESIGVSRSSVWITNLVKCRPPNNDDPTPDHVASCSPRWLDTEIAIVRPKLIVTLGVHSSRYLLGDEDFEMAKQHGIPRTVELACLGGESVTVLPVYHPSAGLQERSYLRWINQDFETIRKLINDEPVESPKDEYPQPQYKEVTTTEHALELLSLPYFAIDTETVKGPDGRSHLWSIQVSNQAGEGWFIPVGLVTDRDVVDGDPVDVIPPTSTVLVHNYLYDARFIKIPNPLDTMVMAYLLQYPLGLKTLSYRLCGMEMQEYEEYTLPLRRTKALDYLRRASEREWPDPPKIEDWVWDNKTQEYKTKVTKPHHIKRKIAERIKKAEADPNYDPYLKWRDIDARERAVVEGSDLGPLLDASLADIPREESVYYSSRDPDATWRVGQKLLPLIEEMGLSKVLGWLDLPMVPVALEMMLNGMVVDPEALESVSAKCKGEMVRLADEISRVSGGTRINANSPDQVAALVYGWKKGDKRRSTEDRELKKSKHPAVPFVQESREYAKMKDSYADKLIPYLTLEEDGHYRTHPTIRITGTETGRLRVSDPPLQAIPHRTALGREVRAAFKASTKKRKHKLVAIDYSQIEMRVLAHVSKCRNLIDLFCQGKDMHTNMASRCFEITEEEVIADEFTYRYPIKRLHFGIVYGITPVGLYNGMLEEGVPGWDIQRCADFIDLYFNMNPEIKDYTYEYQRYARRDGYVRDPLFGRIRYIPEIQTPFSYIEAEGERQAANMPIAAAAQGLIKLATGWVMDYRNSLPEDKQFRFLMQVHDELIFEMPEEHVEELVAECSRLMESVGEFMSLDVPLIAEAKVGDDWGNMEKLKVAA